MSASQKNSKIIKIIGVVALVASVFIILFTGNSGLTQSAIEHRLQQIGANITATAASNGREAKLTYSSINLIGWGFDKRAIVSDVSLDIAEKSVVDTTHWLLSTMKMQVQPAPGMPNQLLFIFADPVNIIENGQLKSIVTFSTPLRYAYFDGYERKAHVIEQGMRLPDRITLNPAKTADQPAKDTMGKITITYDKSPVWRMRLTPDSGERDAVQQFHNVKIAADNGTEITVASIDNHLKEKPGADKRPEGSYNFTLVDFTFHDASRTTKSYTVHADFTYSGDMPMVNMDHLTSSGNTNITLNQFLLANDDFTIKVNGALSTATDDPLPAGNVNLDIDNVQQFLNSELVPEASRKIIQTALQKITGQPAESLTNIEIPLKRDKDGMLYVGSMPFEELAAATLADMIKASPSGTPAAPAPSPVPAPASAPVALPAPAAGVAVPGPSAAPAPAAAPPVPAKESMAPPPVPGSPPPTEAVEKTLPSSAQPATAPPAATPPDGDKPASVHEPEKRAM